MNSITIAWIERVRENVHGIGPGDSLVRMHESSPSGPYALVCHPQSLSSPVESIEVMLDWSDSGMVKLGYILIGDISHVVVPAASQPRRATGLWKHTCFEIFAMDGDGPQYREFNFSPSGEWAAYDFRDYRDGGEFEAELEPRIKVQSSRDRLQLDAIISKEFLPQGQSLRLGLSAVVEAADGSMAYWALRHPPGKPDFHSSDAFGLEHGFRISAALRPE